MHCFPVQSGIRRLIFFIVVDLFFSPSLNLNYPEKLDYVIFIKMYKRDFQRITACHVQILLCLDYIWMVEAQVILRRYGGLDFECILPIIDF